MGYNKRDFCYSDGFGSFEFVLDMFDRNKDGLLQYDEFLDMADAMNVSPAQITKIRTKFFPTKREELQMDEFSDLFTQLFDFNDDGLLQHDEFIAICTSLDVEDDLREKLETQYFPLKSENLDTVTFLDLMGKIDGGLIHKPIFDTHKV